MTIGILLILFITSMLALVFNQKKTSVLLFIFTLTFSFVIGSGLLAGILLNNLQLVYQKFATPTWGKRNAIVMLGAGNVKVNAYNLVKPSIFSFSRILKTASIYGSCKLSKNQCTIILSGGDPQKTGAREAETAQRELLALGVPPGDILLEGKSQNTYKNAEYTSRIIKSANYNQVVLVSSGIHLRRALKYFSNFGVAPIPVAADYLSPIYSLLPQSYNFALADFAIHEYMGICRFHIYNFMGWNAK